MQLTSQQQKKIKKIAGFTDDHNTEVAKSLMEIDEKLDEQKTCLDEMMSKEHKDYTNHLEMILGTIMEKLGEEKEDEEIIVELKII